MKDCRRQGATACPSCAQQISRLTHALRRKDSAIQRQKLQLISLSFRQEMKEINSSFDTCNSRAIFSQQRRSVHHPPPRPLQRKPRPPC